MKIPMAAISPVSLLDRDEYPKKKLNLNIFAGGYIGSCDLNSF